MGRKGGGEGYGVVYVKTESSADTIKGNIKQGQVWKEQLNKKLEMTLYSRQKVYYNLG